MKSNYKKFRIGDVLFKSASFVLMGLFAASFIIGFLWMLFSSFRTAVSFSAEPLKFWKIESFDFGNYITAFGYKVGRNQTNMLGMLKNSFLIIVVSTLLSTMIPSITGYVAARYKFRGNRLLTVAVLIAMIVPGIGTLTSTYRFMNSLKLIDTFFGYFVMGAGGLGFSFLLYKNFYGSISGEYAESAALDGAGNFRVYWSIMLPQARSILIALSIVGAIGTWNDFFTPYMYLPSHPTVAYGVQLISVRAGINYTVTFSIMTFMTVVVLIVYSCFSKIIMESVSVGGVKG